MAGTDNLKSWQPGQSGNPGGITSEQRKRILANAEMATRIREHLLQRELALIEAPVEDAIRDAVRVALKDLVSDKRADEILAAIDCNLTSDRLKLIKDSEDRGFGAPKQTAEVESNVHIFRTIYETKPDDAG